MDMWVFECGTILTYPLKEQACGMERFPEGHSECDLMQEEAKERPACGAIGPFIPMPISLVTDDITCLFNFLWSDFLGQFQSTFKVINLRPGELQFPTELINFLD